MGEKEELKKYGDLMKLLHEKGREEGREFGFLFCERDKKLFPSMTTTGGERAIEKIVDCEMFEAKAKGYFHTHPHELGLSLPSAGDVCYSWLKKLDLLCLSGEIPRRIACYRVDREKASGPCGRLLKAVSALEVQEAESEITEKLGELVEEIYVKPLSKEKE